MSASYLADINILQFPAGSPERIIALTINMYNLALRGAVVPRDPISGAPMDSSYSIKNTESIFASQVKSTDFYYELSNPATATQPITATITLPAGYYFYYARSTQFSLYIPGFAFRGWNYTAFGIFNNPTTQSAVATVGYKIYDEVLANLVQTSIAFGGQTFGSIYDIGSFFTTYSDRLPVGLLTLFKL